MDLGKLTLTLVCLASFVNNALAVTKYVSGNDLLNYCSILDTRKGDPFEGGLCVGYIEAVADAGDCANAISGWKFDIPSGVTVGQMEKTVVKWLNQNPDKLHHIGSKLVAFALSDNFPCK